jgi:hypothetical protein
VKNTPNTSSCHYGGISPAAGLTNSSILLPTRVYQVERHEERYDLLPNKVDWENEDEAGVSQKESEQDTYIFGLGTFLSCQPPPGEQQLVWELKMARLSMMQSLRNSPELSDELTSLSDEQVSTTRGSEEKLFCGARPGLCQCRLAPSWVLQIEPAVFCFGTPSAVATPLHSLNHTGGGGVTDV